MGDAPTPAIDMRGITKTFGPVKALVDADLIVNSGSIHGLVGQNGAGKSTIIKVLAGILRPNSGTVHIGGQLVSALTPKRVEGLGVHFIHQDRLLVPAATVAEAIFLRNEPRVGPFVNYRAMSRQAGELLQRYFGLSLDPQTLIRDLTTAQQKIVQITRALAQNAKVLVLDEPTAALVNKEVESLFAVLRTLRDQGIAIIFISHYMAEIEDLCDTVTVMRNGTRVGVADPRRDGVDAIVSLMTNRDVGDMYPRRNATIGQPMLEVKNLALEGAFSKVNLNIRRGEIVGLTGLLGSGDKQLIKCLFGLERPDAGTITVDGTPRSFSGATDAVKAEIAMVPEDRRAHGVALGLSVAENISLSSLKRYSRNGFVSRAAEYRAVNDLIRELSIKTPDGNTLVRNLSGGNQQKVAVAKWLSCQSKVYLLDEPTVAVDVGAKIEIYALISRLAEEGAAILFNSSDLEELVEMCDRVLVIYRGELTHEFVQGEADSDRLLAAASGARAAETTEVA